MIRKRIKHGLTYTAQAAELLLTFAAIGVGVGVPLVWVFSKFTWQLLADVLLWVANHPIESIWIVVIIGLFVIFLAGFFEKESPKEA